ncbi:MAG TPA: anthranilate phosphoribosyltransferase [Deltaproteobacteria bacterium]|nr:anthranilate phosphoribosyltransferase [Deltaproteobacteria bacterium]
MKGYIEKLIAGQDLSTSEMEQAFEGIMSGQVPDVQIGAFLVALRAKGEKPEEIAAAARIMHAKALSVEVGCDVVDTCGTGGDGASTFNISTAAAFVLAGAGYKVAKHGNRSVSSSSGSADCLEALGVPINLGPDEAAQAVREKGFAFLFAPGYHPSMKFAMPARKQLGIKTVFNILGPLANPAQAAYQLIGVFSRDLIMPMIETLRLLGLKGAMVVHSGLDEVCIVRPTEYARLSEGRITTGTIVPQEQGIRARSLDELRVGTPQESARLIEAVFTGEKKGACRESVLINAGAAFMALGAVPDIQAGMALADTVIDDGAALAALKRVQRSEG